MRYHFYAYVVVQLLIPMFALLFCGNWLGDQVALWLVGFADPHGFVKGILESSQGMLLRQQEVFWTSILFPLMVGLVSMFQSYIRNIALLVILIFVAVVFPFRSSSSLIFMALLICCLTVEGKGVLWFRWVPYLSLALPNLLFSTWKGWSRALIVAFFACGGNLFCLWLDCLLSYEQIRSEMEAWPEELLDERIVVRAQNPGVRADWHGVDIHGDYAFVIAEETMRLMAFPMEGGDPISHQLGDRWGEERAAPLDMEYDARSGLFWLLTDEAHISGFSFAAEEGWKWKKQARLPFPLFYTYMRLYEGKMVIAPIQVKGGKQPDFTIALGQNYNWNQLRAVINDFSTIKLPFPREIELIGSMDKLALSPDFGKEIFLFDIHTGRAERLIESPTLDGKMRWVEELDRLFVALPNRFEIWVIDPHTKQIDWKIKTQPGVRSLAIDHERGVIVNASVLTGQILVQDLRTGELLDRFGTVMPMVRELALDTERGQAIISTWAAVYQFPYADKL